jgi:DNA topoisomerase IA
VEFEITLSKKRMVTNIPKPFDLTGLYKYIAPKFGFSADETKKSQTLYEQKWTYPRVDTILPSDIYPKVPGILQTPPSVLSQPLLEKR